MKEFDNIIKYQMESGGSVATILEVGICIYASSKKNAIRYGKNFV